jgi:flagellar hook protein FlgE
MSIYGSLTTAVTGLNAQSAALGAISDNIANAQTVGYKRVDTSFQSMVLSSNERMHSPGGVASRPIYVNNIQGSPTQSQIPTNVSLQGAGFFSVSKLSQGLTGPGQVGQTVQTQTGTLNAENVYYTRAGDFQLDSNRYLVNSAGFALNGWLVDPVTGKLNKDEVQPIQVNTLIDRPEATNTITYAANLPSKPKAGYVVPTSSIGVIDAQGNQRKINIDWRQQGDSDWRCMITAPGSSVQPVSGAFAGYPANVQLGQVIEGRAPTAQRNTLTIGGGQANGQDQLRVGETYKVVIDGVTYPTTITAANVGQANTYSGLAGIIANNINSASPSPPVVASVTGNVITLSAKDPGTGFTLAQSVDKKAPVSNTVIQGSTTVPTASSGEIQRFSFPQSQIDIGDAWKFNVTNNATGASIAVSLTVTAQNYSSLQNITGIVEALANQINSLGGGVTATASGGVLSIQNNLPGATATMAISGGFPSPVGPQFISNAGAQANTSIIALSQLNVSGIKQQQTVTLTGTPGDTGTQYTISINNAPITYTTTGEELTMAQITQALANKINADTSLPVQATSSGGVIQLIAKDAINTSSFTSTPNATNPGDTDIKLNGSGVDIGDSFTITDNNVPPNSHTLTITAANYATYNTPDKVMQFFAAIPTVGGTVSGGLLIGASGTWTGSVAEASGKQFTLAGSMASAGQTPAYIGIKFATTSNTGTISSISTANVGTGTAVTTANQTVGADATITCTVDYGYGPQQITLNLGMFQRSGGLTQYTGEEISISKFVQDGVQRGQFKDVKFDDKGQVLVNYDNGRSKVVARVPVVTFNNPNALQRETGGVFLESENAGKPNFNDSGTNGAASVIANSLEGSNVDIADEFTKLIVTQRSYSANTKIVTTSDEMLQEVLGLKR